MENLNTRHEEPYRLTKPRRVPFRTIEQIMADIERATAPSEPEAPIVPIVEAA